MQRGQSCHAACEGLIDPVNQIWTVLKVLRWDRDVPDSVRGSPSLKLIDLAFHAVQLIPNRQQMIQRVAVDALLKRDPAPLELFVAQHFFMRLLDGLRQ